MTNDSSKLIEMLYEGEICAERLAYNLIKYLPEDNITDFMLKNGYIFEKEVVDTQSKVSCFMDLVEWNVICSVLANEEFTDLSNKIKEQIRG